MDVATLGIFLGSFFVCAGLVFLVSVFGAKERTFEEALAEEKKRKLEAEAAEHRRRNTNTNVSSSSSVNSANQKKAKFSKKSKASSTTPTASATAAPQQQREVELKDPASHSAHRGQEEVDDPTKGNKKKRRKRGGDKSESEVQFPTPAAAVVVENDQFDHLEVHRQYLNQDDVVEIHAGGDEEKDEQIMQQVVEEVEETPAPTPEPPAPAPPCGPASTNQAPLGPAASGQIKSKSKKKNIIEVEELVVVKQVVQQQQQPLQQREEQQQQQQQEQQQMKANKKETKKQEASSKGLSAATVGKLSGKELISIVKKTSMDDDECQYLIDLLLNKQVGGGRSGAYDGEWIESSGSGKNSTQVLQKQLAEKEAELQEVNDRVKSISDRMGVLRQELNSTKSSQSNALRVNEELQARHQRDIQNLQSRLQQQIDTHNREYASLQNQLQSHLSRNQQLEATIAQLTMQQQQQQQQEPEPQLYQELEQLRITKEQYEAQLKEMQGEDVHLRSQLASLQDQISETETKNAASVKELTARNKNLEEKCNFLEKTSNSSNDLLQEKIEELLRSKAEAEKQIKQLSSQSEESSKRIKAQEAEISHLAEDNERLSEQLASVVERPKAEGQEAGGGKINGDLSGGREVTSSLEINKEEEGWQKKYLNALSEKEDLVSEHEVIVENLKGDLEKVCSQLTAVEEELGKQRAKNNELRTKNWTVLDALNIAEQRLMKLNQKNDARLSISKIKTDYENAQRAFLLRLFPDSNPGSEVKDHSEWLTAFERIHSQSLSKQSKTVADVEHLEKQVSHYQSVLAETESMLKKLQASVESEEVTWKQKLSEKETEIAVLNQERDLSAKRNEAHESLNVVCQAEEMQVKLKELQTKLSMEEAEKAKLVKKFSEVDEQLLEKERLAKEVESLQEALVTERKNKNELAEKFAKMGQLVSTGQEALQQEKKTVEILRDQITSSKRVGNDSNPSTDNGPSDIEKF